MFVDFLGPLGGENVATWTAAAANKAVDQQRQQIQAAVRQGFITRAAADWHVRALPYTASLCFSQAAALDHRSISMSSQGRSLEGCNPTSHACMVLAAMAIRPKVRRMGNVYSPAGVMSRVDILGGLTGVAVVAVQTVEAREDFKNRTLSAIKAGAQFIQTSFPDVSKLPKYAYSFPGTSNATVFPTNYTVSAPLPTLVTKGLIFSSLIAALFLELKQEGLCTVGQYPCC